MGSGLSIHMNQSDGGMVAIPLEDLDERDLILRCQSGDKAAFEPIVTRYMRRAAAFALGWVGNREDALDLSQDAFARAYKALPRFEADRPFYPWFHRILRNLCINYIGRAKYQKEVPLEDDYPLRGRELSPLEHAERSELRAAVWAGIEQLSEQDREILVLREFQGLSYTEIAESLEIPKGTVMSRLHNARRRLKDKLTTLVPEKVGREET